MASDDDWWSRAACRGVGPDLFFAPMRAGRPRRDGTQPDLTPEPCHRCTVRDECLAEGVRTMLWLSLLPGLGSWGGRTAREVRELARASELDDGERYFDASEVDRSCRVCDPAAELAYMCRTHRRRWHRAGSPRAPDGQPDVTGLDSPIHRRTR
jgi:hypothetical protein